jgi:hypothetical protein
MSKARARQAYNVGIYVLAAAVVTQFLLAGLGIFGDASFFFFHAVVNASLIAFLPLLLVLVGWYAGVPVRTRWLTASIFGLTVLQSLLLVPYHSGASEPLRWVSGLHALNAVLIFWIALQLLDRVRHPRELKPAAPSGDGEASRPVVESIAR